MEKSNSNNEETNSKFSNISKENSSNYIDYSYRIIQSSIFSYISKSENEKLYKFIICPKCCSTPEILFKTTKSINILCNCSKIENDRMEDIINNYIIGNKNIKVKIGDYSCKIHFNKKYEYFCKDCNKNICRDCKVIDDKHSTHELLPFLEYESKFQKIEEKIGKVNENFKEVIKVIIENYKNYPNYNLYKNINNVYNLLNDNTNFDNCEHNENINEIIKWIKIRSPKELSERINNIDKIIEIQIIRQNFYDLSKICNLELTGLKVLNLSENNINDINPLSTAKFENLESLILLKNKIDDKNIDYIKQFKFPKLKTLNFYYNYFTNYKIFDEIKNFKNLEKLYIGSNRFNEKIENIDLKKTKYEFLKLKAIGLTNGVFSEKSIKLISCFEFPELKELYLSGNNLKSLSFLEYLNCPKLEEIWLKDNNIKDYNLIGKLENIKKINLDNNLIDNLEDLKQIKTKKLSISLSNNKIDLKNERTKLLIEELKNIIELNLKYF